MLIRRYCKETEPNEAFELIRPICESPDHIDSVPLGSQTTTSEKSSGSRLGGNLLHKAAYQFRQHP